MSQKYYCPYCNHEYDEEFCEEYYYRDRSDRELKMLCQYCKKRYMLKINVSVDYDFKKQCEWNDEKHQWKDIGNECVKCSVCDFVELKKNAEGWKE